MRNTGAFLACSLVSVSLTLAARAYELPPFDVPRVDNVTIDGRFDDWNDGGFRVVMLTSVDGRALPKTDLDATFRLGWNSDGLLVALTVHDDVHFEHASQGDLWRLDSIEMFLAPEPGADDFVQVVVAPGMDRKHPEVRYSLIGYGGLAGSDELGLTVARAKTTTGYRLEALLPWSNIAVQPALGRVVGFQLWITDADGVTQNFVATWYPGEDTSKDATQMHRLRLASDASPTASVIRAHGSYDLDRMRTDITIVASDDQAGKAVAILEGDKTVARSRLEPDESGRVMARFRFPPPIGKPSGQYTVVIDEKTVEKVDLPNFDRQRAEAFLFAGPTARPSVFSGELPEVRFERPLWLEALIGPYQIKTTYYDSEYNVVTGAQEPGRYAAVAEIVTESGQTYRRFLTLCCLPAPLGWSARVLDAPLAFGPALGVDAQAVATHPGAVADLVNGQLRASFNRSTGVAVLLAGLGQSTPAEQIDQFYRRPEQLDRQWWVGLKRKLYGWDKQFAEPFICPRPLEGEPAPIVRDGTLQQAGMDPDAADKIDAVLTEWAADTDEAFAVCVVRNGVIVLHKAYGTRDGKPMTVTTKSWMASLTKMLSGTLMMMLVDQGLIDLDDRADKYLPPLRGRQGNQPLTIRHLYTHTSGMAWHWGSDVNDMEERIASLLPFYEVGKRYAYNGTGMELACKILEGVSGESLPNFYRNHLLGPVGCEHTHVGGASSDAASVPLDMARIGQMLLNKGAYGNMRFMSPQTFEKMLPQRLTKVLGPDTKEVYGMGTRFFEDEGLGKGTFAHGAASAAILRIDPENDLVVVMTRNAAGKNFEKYRPRFINAVVQGIAR